MSLRTYIFGDEPGVGDDDYWGEDPNWPVSDWKYEVANDMTRKGYWSWRNGQRAVAAEEARRDDANGS